MEAEKRDAEKATAMATEIRAALMDALSPYMDDLAVPMGVAKTDVVPLELRIKVVALLLGCRGFVSTFLAVEEELMNTLFKDKGLREWYNDLRIESDAKAMEGLHKHLKEELGR